MKTVEMRKEEMMKDLPKFPICDNCGQQIIMFGKYIMKKGIRQYVHFEYNEETNKCLFNNDIKNVI